MRLRAFIAGVMLAMTFGLAQAQPNWSTVPSIVSVGPLGVTVRFGIDVPGTVYIIVFNSNVTTALTSTYVRNAAIAGPSGGMVATAVITVTAGQANMTLQQYFDLVNAARTHALYIVAANASGTLQADPVRLGFTTLACPSVKLKTYFGNLGECVNLGAVGYFSASAMPATPTGVLKGTVWTIDWGDGTTWSYTSTADGDIPVDQFHTFTTITDCNYVGVWTIQNPCGEFSNGSSVFVVHGREIPDDGDGDIRMQEPVSGDFDITYVCEGKETNLVVRDETTWNCQDPEVPAPLIAIPNTSNRNIQFVYGETPAGAIMNTITGDVLIGGVNTANSGNGYVGPVLGAFPPPNPNTVSDIITIPSSAKAGERFYVYLKYWNKCNPLVDENLDYVDDFFIIEVVEAPDPPQVVSPQTYCFGNVPATVSATPNTAGNTINWYSDAALTNLLYTGTTYTHGITGPGTFTLYATEVIGTGGCEGPAAPLVLIITPGVDDNTISADQTICYNTVPAAMTGLVPSGGSGAYTYLWQRSTTSATSGFSDAPGVNNGQNYTPPSALTTTAWYRRIVYSGLCTDYSNVIKVTVYSTFSPGTVKSAQSICYNTEPDDLTVATAPSGGSGTYTYQWQQSSDNVNWSGISGATSSTYSPPALTASTYYRRIVTDSQCGSLPTASILITVYGDLTAGQIGSSQTICYNTAPATITNTASPTGGDGTYYYRWYRSTNNGSSWQQISGAYSVNYSPGSLTQTTWYRRRVTNTCGTEYTTEVVITVLGPVTAGSVGSPQTICYNTAPATLTELTAPTGGIGTYTYQWQSSPNNTAWSTITGATSATYSPGALTATTYFRRVVTSGTCGSANSGSVLITVYGQLNPGTVGPAQSICYNTAPATLTQVTAPSGGTGTYTYQWQRSTDNVNWTTITGATSSSYSPGTLTVSTWYRRNVTSGICGSVNGTAVLITVYGDLTPGSIGSPQTICYNTAPATLTQTAAPGGGSGVYTYQWQRSTDNVTWNDISGATSATYTPGALTVPVYFRRNVTSSTCGTVSSNSVLISLYSTLTLAQLNSDISICNNTSTTFFVDITGGTPPYTVNYNRNGSAQTALTNYTSGTLVSTGNLTTGTYVYELTSVTDSHGCQAQSLGSSITVSVGTAPTAATFTGSGDLCYNTPAYLTSVITGGGAPYKLYITGLAVSPVTNFFSGDNIDLGVLAPGTYTYTLTRVDDNCGQTLSAGLPISHTFTVFGPLDGGTIGTSQTICYNTLPASFTNESSPSGGTALTYQWQKSPAGANSWVDISGANSLAYSVSANLTASTDYRRVTTSGNGCGTVYSNVITVTVYGNLTPGSVGASQSICFNTAPAALTQTTAPAGGTGTYTYQWQSSIDNVSWNIISGATGTSYTPAALTVSTWFRLTVTSGTCGTVSTAPVLVTVYGDLTPGTIGSNQSICYNSVPATLTSLTSPSGGTGVYTYQWQVSTDNITWSVITGATSASYSPGSLTSDRYYRRNVTSGTCGTVSSAPVHIIVYANLLPGAIGTSQTICYNTTPAALTEFGVPTGGTGTYTYQWQTSSDNVNWFNLTGAISSTYAPGALTATTYFRRAVTSGTCGTVYSGNVLITVYPNLTPGSVGTAQSICYNTIPAPLTETAAPAGGTGTYTYQWQRSTDNVNWTSIGGANSATYSPGALTVSTWFRRNVTSGTCGTVSSAPVLITVYGELLPGSVGNAQFLCYNTAAATLTELTAPSGGTGTYTYQWQRSVDGTTFGDISGATSPTYSPGTLTSSYYYRRSVTSGTCGTVNSAPVLITVYADLAPGTIGSNQSICYNTIPAAITELTAATGGTGTYTYQWQSSPDNATWSIIMGANSSSYSPGALTATIYYRRLVTSGTCGTLSSPPVQIIVYPDLTAGTVGSPQTICQNDAAALLTQLTPATGGTGTYTYQWQSSPDNSTWGDISGALSADYAPGVMTVTTYFRRNVTSGSCGTLSTPSVKVTVIPLPVISDQSASVCSGETLSHSILLDNYTNPGDNVTFTWPAPTLSAGLTGGTDRTVASADPLGDVFVNVSGGPQTATYYVTPYYAGCTGPVKAIVVTIGSQPVMASDLDRSLCSGLPTGLVLAVAPTSVPATTYNILSITVPAGLVPAAGNKAAASGVADPAYLSGDIFTNETGVDKYVIYRAQPVYGTTCIGDPVDITVTIHPQPKILPGQKKTVCSSTPVNMEIKLIPVNLPAGTLFSWGLPLLSDGSIQGTAVSGISADPPGSLHITDVLVNYGATPITATYSVTPESADGCVGTVADVIITINPEPAAPVITGADTLCIGETTVVYTVPLHSGSSYTWTVPASVGVKTFDLNSNAIIITAAATAGSGTISVTETNSYGCTGVAGTFDVTVMGPSPVSPVAGDNTVCALEATGYSVPFNDGSVYTWSLPVGAALVGDPTASAITVVFGTVSGNISVREVNAAGCITDHTPLPVTVRPQPTAVISNTGTVCQEDTFPVNISLTGATPWTVIYAINGVNQVPLTINASPYTLTATSAGTYTIVSVADANGCSGTGTGSATVSYYPRPTATISGTTAMCAGGSAVLTISLTGTAPYNFEYSDGTITTTVTNYISSVYTATVTPAATTTYTLLSMSDSHGCEGTLNGTAVVTVNNPPVLTLAPVNLSCYSNNSGSIGLTVAGAGPFSYAWTGPDGYTAGVEDISSLAAGYYSVTVTDVNGCTATASTTLTQPPVLVLGNTGNISLACSGDDNGSGSFTPAGGTAPYSFIAMLNTTGSTFTSTTASASFTDAGPGTLTVQVTDANGCQATSTITVTEPAPVVVTAVLSLSTEGSHNINCYNGATGTITLSVAGGTSPYSYNWTTADGSGLKPAVANQTGLTAGTYTVTVTDAHGCQAIESYTLTQPSALNVAVSADDNIIGTCTTSESQLTAAASGGVELSGGGYSYSWSPAAGLSATNVADPVAKPAATTTYTVIVTDANGCTATGSVTVEVRPLLVASVTASDMLIGDCAGSSSSLDVTVTGGEGPFTYLWDNAATLSDAMAKNPVATPAVTTTYTVTVTDNNGCTATASVTVAVTLPVTVGVTVSDNLIGTCSTSEAQLNATASGGEAPYSYQWDNGTTLNSDIIYNPVAKPASTTVYTVTVTDKNGCTASGQVTVNVAPALTVSVSATDNIIGTCPSSVSVLTATVSGGEELAGGGYTYSWSPAAGLNYTNVQSPVAKPAVTTTYTVTVTDRNGCTATGSVTITVNPPLSLTAVPAVYAGGYNIRCKGGSDGSVDLTVNGGEGPYAVSWAGPSGFTSIAQDISGLVAGTYSVIVTDANGCSSTTTVVLSEPAQLTMGTTPDVVLSCYGDNNASGSFSVSGGTAPYTISPLSNTSGASVVITGTGMSFTGGSAGEVTASVTDANGCTTQATIYITEPDELLPGSVNGDQEVCFQGDPSILDQVTAPSGGPGTILFQWERSTDGGGTWNSVSGATMASYDPPAGITVTTLFRRRASSGTCDPVYSNTVTVTVNPLPVASITGAALVCPGDAAVLRVNITVGESPYNIVLSDGTILAGYLSGTDITVNPVVPTVYTITSVTDNNGCSVTAPHLNLTGSATIDIKGVPDIAVQPSDQSVCEGEAAVFTVDAGGTTNPTYQWYYDAGSGPQLMPGETAATLSVTAVTAMNGYTYHVVVGGDCPPAVTSDEVTLTVKELPEIASGPSDVTVCAGDDATLTVDAGATTNPVYQWYVNTGSGWNPVTGSRYQGATTNTLTIVSVLELMTGYQYKVRVSGDCLPYVESAAVILTVTRPTEITQQPLSQTVCEGAPASFTVNAGVTSSPAYQWETSTDEGVTWNIIPGATSATYTIASATTAMNNTMYRVVVSGSCGPDVTSQVVWLVVNELPEIVTPPADLVLCEGEIGNFTVDAGNTAGAVYTWQISTDSGVNWVDMSESAKYFGVASPNLKINGVLRTMTGYMFRVIVAGTCIPPVTSTAATLTVNTRPEITDQPDPASICETESTSFTVTAVGTGLTYLWYVDKGGGLGFEALTDGGVYTGTDGPTLTLTAVPVSYNNYRYRVVVTGTCTPPASSDIVTLNVALTTAITSQPVSQTICEFGAVSFDVTVAGADLTYQWQQYNGTSWTDVTNNGTFMGATTNELTIFGATRSLDQYRYRVIIGSKCSADITSAEATLTVNVSPALTDQPDDVKSCPGSTVSYSVTATGSGLAYQWQVNSGSGFADVTDGAPYSGTTTNMLTISNLTLGMNGYLVRAIVSGTCMPPVYSSYASLSVYAEPVIMTQPADAQVCDGSTVVFYSQVYTTAAGETMRWQVDDGSGWSDLSESGIYQGTQTSQLLIPTATSPMNGWYYRLQVTGPCGNYYSNGALLMVNQLPDGLISPSDTLLVCGGVPTQLHGNPTGGSGTYTNHRWFGDVGPLSQFNIENPVFNTTFQGYYKLVYQVTDSKGCIGIDTVVVEVEKPVAMFTADHPSGCQPLTVTFTNSSSGYTSLLWDFGDGQTSTDENPTHIYPNPSSSLLYYTVSLTVTSANGCSSVMTSDITVYPEVMSDFFFSDDEICSGETVTLSSLPGGFKYYWNFGDGEEGLGANVINHTFTNYTTAPVTYYVTLTATSFFGCEGSTTLPIVVYPVPIPGFTATPVSQTMPNSTVTFTNTTNAGTWTWLWKFGDGNTSADKDPVYTYSAPGTYTVSLLVSNGVCSDAISHSISILPTPPIADFDSIPSGCKVWTIAPVNTSLYATTYYWEFGDGGVSTAKDPVYTYTTAGVYRVTLTVTGPGGTDSKSQLVSVYQSPLAYFEVSPSTVYVNDEKIRCFNLSEGAVSYIWEFGDGDTSHVADPYHRYTREGIYNITLHAYSANGCYDTYVLSPAVTVVPFGDLSFATVFRPNQTGEINLDELPTSGDAVNQFFYPPIRETVVGYHLQIFNRWGTLIYESYDINKPWNGYYQHKLCPQGVYVWLVEGKYANGRPFKKVGDITLLH